MPQLNGQTFLNQLAQSSNCTVNGKSVDCDQFFEPVIIFLTGIGVFLLFIGVLFLVGFIFWIISLIHLLGNEDVNERTVWILLVLFVPLMQFIYFFGPRRNYEKRRAIASSLAPNNQKQ